MSDETLYDLRCYVSNCFNHRESAHADSGYMMLSKLMKDDVVSVIEDMVSNYIMDNSPKFTDNEKY